jgi:putative transposase
MKAFISTRSYSMNQLYRSIGISKQAVHKYQNSFFDEQERLIGLATEVDQIRGEHGGCGVEKMYYMIKPEGIGRDKFIESMMKMGYRIQHPKNFIRTTYSIQENYYPNLISGLQIMSINRVWQTDITYYLVGNKFCYITFIIDVYSRRIIGYYASENLRAEANIKALIMAFKNRKGMDLGMLIHHSDRGSQYIDKQYNKLLNENNISISMSINAKENAYAERINGIIKNEYLKYKSIDSLAQLRSQLSKAVNNYNNKRIHNELPFKQSPNQFEEKLLSLNTQRRPKVIVYAEGNYKIKEASSLLDFDPEEEPLAHVCPIKMSEVLLTKTVNLI